MKVVDKHLGLKQINQPEVEADREAFKNLRETTEVLEQTLKELQDNLASKNSLINSLNTDLQRLETEKSKIAATAAAADKGHYHCDRHLNILCIAFSMPLCQVGRIRELEDCRTWVQKVFPS